MSRRRDVQAQGLDSLAEAAAKSPDGRVDVFAAAAVVGSAGRGAALSLHEVVTAWNSRHPGDRMTVRAVKDALESAHRKLREALKGCI